jgi:hypothetical protein
MTYELRDERGVLRMKISDNQMAQIMRNGYGFFRPSRNDISIHVYEITEDFLWALGESCKIYVWEKEVFKKAK